MVAAIFIPNIASGQELKQTYQQDPPIEISDLLDIYSACVCMCVCVGGCWVAGVGVAVVSGNWCKRIAYI